MFHDENVSYRSGIPKKFYHLKDTEFDDWEIPPWEVKLFRDQCLGRGAFGVVYKGVWRFTEVAVKVFEDESFIEEFNTLTHVRHPNVVQLLGYVKNPSMIVMEYLPGGSPKKLSKHNMIEILTALYYLHERKPTQVIHRDIKPSNIVMSKSGRPKLVDFGLSRFGKKTIVTEPYSIGTKQYQAPEIKLGSYDHRIDIWSTGVLFYEMCKDQHLKKFIKENMIQEDPTKRMDIPTLIRHIKYHKRSSTCFFIIM